ncbi:hypothetical protein, conserved [Eimeria maxima]|uniref:Uncharacterized protein n=1 Tax=Eimeria maxima TaxID=5804 RepID=U6M8M5_EIMMA|nr:hypothetical protein, conserved [Eimeria maxima]CDJ58839.1 hypothetical protein, conserved [Eimeria maxima]
MLPRRLFAVLQEPCLSSYPQGSDSQRESRQSPAAGVGVSPEGPSGGAATGAPAAAAAAAAATYAGPPKAGLDATVGPLPVSPYDPAQQPPPYGQFGSGDALHGSYGETSGAAHTPGGPGVTEGPYGPPPFGYYSAPVTSFPGYSMGPPPFIAAPLQGMGCYPAPPPLGAPYGMGTPYGAPPSGGPPQSWMPGDPQGGVWGPARPHNVRGNGPSGEGGGPPAPQTARERQRQFLSASALTEFDSLEAKCSFGLFLKGLSEGKLAGRMGFKEWLYATNVVSDMLRREVQHETNYDLLLHQQLLLLQQILKLLQRGRSNFLPHDVALLAANAGRLHGAFCMHFLTRQTQKAQEVLNAPSKELRKALQQAATEPAAAAAAAAAAGAGGVGGVEQLTEGPLTLSVYRGVCDAIVSEIVFSCARKLHSFPPSTQPSHVRALPTLMRAASAQLLPRDTSSSNNQQQYTAKRVKAVWTELLQRICPLLGRYDVLQLLQVLQGVAALSNRKIIRDNDLLTLTQGSRLLLHHLAMDTKLGVVNGVL